MVNLCFDLAIVFYVIVRGLAAGKGKIFGLRAGKRSRRLVFRAQTDVPYRNITESR